MTGSTDAQPSWDDLPPLDQNDYSEWDWDYDRDGPLECEAWLDWPRKLARCRDDAVFEVHRVADSALAVCPRHLGPVLCNTPNLEWPFTTWSYLGWVGPGEGPRHAMTPEQADARIMQGP